MEKAREKRQCFKASERMVENGLYFYGRAKRSREVMIDIAGKTKEEVLKEAVNIIDCFEPAIDYNYKPDDEHNYLSWVKSRKLF